MRASPPAPDLDPHLHHNIHFSQCHYCHNSSPSLIVALDKIRSKAHQHGWNDAPYNPFGRVRSNESRTTRDLEGGSSTTELPTLAPSNPVHQAGDESPRSPTRIDTDKEEDISGSTFVDGGANGEGLSRRHPKAVVDIARAPVPSLPPPRTDSEQEEERRRIQKEMLNKKIPVGQQIRTVLFPSWYTINWLLLAAPVGIGIKFAHGINPLVVFVVNFLAIIPLAGILSFSTEELALRVGETLGGLLNASFG